MGGSGVRRVAIYGHVTRSGRASWARYAGLPRFQVSGHTSGAVCRRHGRQWLGPPGKRAKVVTRSARSTGACKFCRLSRAQAERFLEEFRARLAKFGLDLSSGQERLIVRAVIRKNLVRD